MKDSDIILIKRVLEAECANYNIFLTHIRLEGFMRRSDGAPERFHLNMEIDG